ncbi:GNAT family N-acetyltransferase [uncultured Brevundimonas sp.]|uniref:GNAT family N-acetyltransferase n=1 Tax=uncultured Brevundimonas sp. TaxID=213418 RepID=UPI0030EBA204
MRVAPPDPEALAALHGTGFDRGWTAATFADLLTQPGVTAITGPDGFVLIRVVADEAEILTLAVRPAARGRGQGGRLIREAASTAAAAGAGRLFLEVAEDNVAARALYRRVGFEAVGRRPRYYSRAGAPPVDALLLSLNLPGPLPIG